MNVLLINPFWTTLQGFEDKIRIPYPLGLGYIAAYLEREDIDVTILDALALGWNNHTIKGGLIQVGLLEGEIARRIKNVKPDFVGISTNFITQADNMHAIARLVKKMDPSIPVVVGGQHPTSQPIECLEDKNIDFVVQGEGELTMLKLVRFLSGNSSQRIEKIDGICFRFENSICINAPRKPITDLDSLPYPAYHLLPMRKYFEAGSAGLTERGLVEKRWVSMITSRGCPFNCFFCSVPTVSGRLWRARSPKNVIDEIEFLFSRYGIKHFYFEDDNLTLDVKRAEKIFDGIVERGLDITWETPNGVRADRINETLVKKMKKSGCIHLMLGIEHGDQRFLNETVKKRLDLKTVEESVNIISKARIPLGGFFIIGIPGENKYTVKKTINFARKLARLGLMPGFSIATPLPNTEMVRFAKARGYLIKENMRPLDYVRAFSHPLLRTEDYEPEDLVRWRKKAIILTTIEFLIHNPGMFMKIPSIRDHNRSPFRLLKRLKAVWSGTN